MSIVNMNDGTMLQVTNKEATMVGPDDQEYTDIFRIRKSEWEAKCTKEKMPYCRACANHAFNLKANMLVMEMQGKGRQVSEFRREGEFFKLAREFDFKEFENESRFELVGESENRKKITQAIGTGGESLNVSDVIESIDVNYVCKINREHRLSINYPMNLYKKRFGSKKVE